MKRTALYRARRRRKEAGAAMFIVAVTLGLLAAMGVYGLAATAYDVRAAGHTREAAQGQHAAELAVIMTSQVLNPGNAQTLVNAMQADTKKGKCTTSKPVLSGDGASNRAAEACFVLTPTTMGAFSQDPTNWPTATGTLTVPFTDKSLGEVPLHPYIRVELTNPINWDAPAGYAVSSAGGSPPVFTQIRATVFVEMRPDLTHPADIVAIGRGRLIVGPYMP